MTITHNRPPKASPDMDQPADPMEGYYGMAADEVARILFGGKDGPTGVFFAAEDDDIPFRVESFGGGRYWAINMLSNEPAGAIRGVVVSQTRAEDLTNMEYGRHKADSERLSRSASEPETKL